MNKDIKYLIEDYILFNPLDYSEDDNGLVDNQTVSNVIYKYFPQNKDELEEIIIKKLRENIEYPYLNDICTSEITDMSDLFSGYMDDYLYMNDINSAEIKKLDLSSWDVSKVINMSCMFGYCESLEVLDISGWDTSSVTDMCYMFYDCYSLEELDISNWDISNVTDMDLMFDECNKSIIPDWYLKLNM